MNTISPVELWLGAKLAGSDAANAHTPQPMHIRGYAPILDGVCGFAYITIKPATGAFVRWLKSQGIGHKAYYGGWEISVREYGQSMERKEAHARAAAQYLSDHGIKASYYSRMD